MGLTIHYKIRFNGSKEQLASKLQEIRSKCRDLPFEEVSKVTCKEISQAAIDAWDLHQWNPNSSTEVRDAAIEKYGLDVWDIIEAMEYKDYKNQQGQRCSKSMLRPKSVIALYIWPGEGCEPSDLRFYKESRQRYWRCKAFCKTQYATHFLRSHLLVIKMLDIVKSTNGFVITKVNDEGDYWETRDVNILAKEINTSTAMIEGIFKALKSTMPDGTVEAGIEKSKNYVNAT